MWLRYWLFLVFKCVRKGVRCSLHAYPCGFFECDSIIGLVEAAVHVVTGLLRQNYSRPISLLPFSDSEQVCLPGRVDHSRVAHKPARIALLESDVQRARFQFQTRHSPIIVISEQDAASPLDTHPHDVWGFAILGGRCEIRIGELAHETQPIETQRMQCAYGYMTKSPARKISIKIQLKSI